MARMQIKRVGVFSYAKIMAVIMTALGLVIGVIYGLIFMIFGAAMMSQGRGDAAGAGMGGIFIGLLFIIGFPIFYGVIGFISGIIGAAIYNVASGVVGGIELELENMDNAGYSAPPPPQWGANPQQPGQQQQYPY